jgi:type III secretion protein W
MPGPIRSDAPFSANPARTQQAGFAQTPAVGSYKGEAVERLPDQASLLQDAAEELTEGIEEDQEKDFSERDITEGKQADLYQRLTAIKELQELLHQLTDLRKGDLARVLRRLARQKHANPDELRDLVKQAFKEPAQQYAALLAHAGLLKQQGAPSAAVAEAAVKQLLDEQGPAIRAGVNVSASATRFAADGFADAQSLRDAYRDAVLDYHGLKEAYGAVLEQHGGEHMPRTLRYLLKALGDDLAAGGASIDKARLHAILDDMYRLEVLSGVLEPCCRLAARGAAQTAADKGAQLLGEVLGLVEDKWTSPERINALPPQYGAGSLPDSIQFLREFRELLRAVPLKAYHDPEQRSRLLDAAQLSLDAAIEQEEEG